MKPDPSVRKNRARLCDEIITSFGLTRPCPSQEGIFRIVLCSKQFPSWEGLGVGSSAALLYAPFRVNRSSASM